MFPKRHLCWEALGPVGFLPAHFPEEDPQLGVAPKTANCALLFKRWPRALKILQSALFFRPISQVSIRLWLWGGGVRMTLLLGMPHRLVPLAQIRSQQNSKGRFAMRQLSLGAFLHVQLPVCASGVLSRGSI